jgi:optic atrophy protein 1
MVKASVEQQADAFKATRFNLETEWKNSFPRLRELDRDELFEKARGEILDEVVNLSQLSPIHWESVLSKKLWEKMSLYVFEQIYLPAAQTSNSGTFNTQVDIKLKQWADLTLPKKAVDVGWEGLQQEFHKLIEKSKAAKDHDDVFDSLKVSVCDEAMKRHLWEEKASEVLRVIQLNALEDRSIPDKQQWDAAYAFLEASLKERLDLSESQLKELVGPGFRERWMSWTYKSPEQKLRSCIKSELEKLLQSTSYHAHPPTLANDELTAVKKNLQTQEIDVDSEMIKQVWYPLYRLNFLKNALNRANDCRKGFYLYSQGLESELDCNDLILFWRIQKMLAATSNALRQQVMNTEGRRLEREIKEALDEYSQDSEKKVALLTGRRVQLAEELKRVRQIQEKLEEFVASLNAEK